MLNEINNVGHPKNLCKVFGYPVFAITSSVHRRASIKIEAFKFNYIYNNKWLFFKVISMCSALASESEDDSGETKNLLNQKSWPFQSSHMLTWQAVYDSTYYLC